jgi:hypothetical protein
MEIFNHIILYHHCAIRACFLLLLFTKNVCLQGECRLTAPPFRLVREILAEKPGEETYVSLITGGMSLQLKASNSVILSCHK